MSIETLHDAPRAALNDALTYSFADADGSLCGVVRLGVAEGAASGLVVLFADGEPAAVRADGAGTAAATWEEVRAAGLRTGGEGPWRLTFDGEPALELDFEALGAPLELAADSPVGRAGGMEGFDHICRVSGSFGGRRFAGRGQRSRSWGAPDWKRMSLARTLCAWFEDDGAFSAAAVRPAGTTAHGSEALAAFVFDAGVATGVCEARLSTTYDGEGRQRAAGLELYVGADDDHARRAAGELVAGTTLELTGQGEGASGLRLDCAFFGWHMEGRRGIGRYDVLRRVA